MHKSEGRKKVTKAHTRTPGELKYTNEYTNRDD